MAHNKLTNPWVKSNLKSILTERNLTANRLAEMAGLSGSAIQPFVTNTQSSLNVVNLAKIMLALNITDFNDIFILENVDKQNDDKSTI